MHNIITSLGWWGRAGRGEEGRRKGDLHEGPDNEQGFVGKEKGVSGNRNNTSKGMEKRNHVVSLGTGCVSKEVTGWKRNEARPDGEELYARCQGTWLYYRRHKGFQKGMISQKMTIWDTLYNVFFRQKNIKLPLATKIYTRKLIPGLLEITQRSH